MADPRRLRRKGAAQMPAPDIRLTRNAFGRLVLVTSDGRVHEDVVPVRAFPISAPGDSIALVGSDGHELAWIERLSDLRSDMRSLLEEELASRDFVPEILRLRHVSSFATPSMWAVETDRGDTVLMLKGEEDIRRLGRSGLLIADRHGIQFLVRDLGALDHTSRRLLDRFL
jgi:Domain of unknown function (DUF1854)